MWKRLLAPAFGLSLALGALSIGCTDNSGNGNYNPNLKPGTGGSSGSSGSSGSGGSSGTGGSDMDAAADAGGDAAADTGGGLDGLLDSLPSDVLDLDAATND